MKGMVLLIVFVVPYDIYDNFKYQNIVTKNSSNGQQNWTKLKNIQQRILKVDICMSKLPTFARTRETLLLFFSGSFFAKISLPFLRLVCFLN
jgi:hypothetical protein